MNSLTKLHNTCLKQFHSTISEQITAFRNNDNKNNFIPKVVLIGDESSGKTSLLQSLCMIPFETSAFFNYSYLEIRLRQEKTKALKIRVGVSEDFDNSINVSDPIKICETMIDLKSKSEYMKSEGFIVEMKTPDCVNCDIIDTPGYYTCLENIEKGNHNKLVEFWTRYIEQNAIFLIVVPVNNEWSLTLNFVLEQVERRENDLNFREKLLFCLTKCEDLLGSGKYLDIVSTKNVSWYITITDSIDFLRIRRDEEVGRLTLIRNHEKECIKNSTISTEDSLFGGIGVEKLVEKLAR